MIKQSPPTGVIGPNRDVAVIPSMLFVDSMYNDPENSKIPIVKNQ